MESLFAEHLRKYTAIRTHLIEYISITPMISTLGIHWILLLNTLVILATIFAQIRKLTLFSMHPVCMTIGTFIFIAEGIIVFNNRFLIDTFGPLMENTKKAKVRSIHQTLHITGGIFISLGLLFISAEKLERKHSLLPSSCHSILGCFSICLLFIQATVGWQKIEYLEWSNTRIKRWHGDSGAFLWDVLCTSVILGLIQFLNLKVMHLFLYIEIIVVWSIVHVAGVHNRKKGHHNSNSNSNNGAYLIEKSVGSSDQESEEEKESAHRLVDSDSEDL